MIEVYIQWCRLAAWESDYIMKVQAKPEFIELRLRLLSIQL